MTNTISAHRKRAIVDHSRTFPIRNWIDGNAIKYLAIIGLSVLLAVYLSPWLILLWPAAILMDDFAMVQFGRTIFDTDQSIRRGYQFHYTFYQGTSGFGRDLGFNYYDGDLTKTHEQAQKDKWDYVIDALGLKPGDSLIDIGCGFGDWLNDARSKGIEVTGVNITPEQARFARDTYGLDVVCANWKDILTDPDLQKRLYGRYDAVTFMDSPEHFVHAALRVRNDQAAIDKIYTDMFALADHLMKPDTGVGRVFASCLHTREEDGKVMASMSWMQRLSTFLMIRYHSGSYPLGKDGLTRYSQKYFDVIRQEDKTEDYRITGVLDPDHFQSPKIRWTPQKALMLPVVFLINPHFVHSWLDLKLDAWMRLFGDDYMSTQYDPQKRAGTTTVVLWWILWQRKPRTSTTGGR